MKYKIAIKEKGEIPDESNIPIEGNNIGDLVHMQFAIVVVD